MSDLSTVRQLPVPAAGKHAVGAREAAVSPQGLPAVHARPHPVRAPRGTHAQLQELADRGGLPHAAEQPGPRGGREPRRAGGLRRHRQGRAQLGLLRSHPEEPARAERGRDAAGAKRQAGGRVPHPCRCAARADRQQQPGAEVGDLGALPRARPQGPDDVRPDDGRQLDLHRQPGHRAGHLRDLRRSRPPALRRQPEGPLDPHRRPGRHGRRAAAGRHLCRCLQPEHRMPAKPHRLPPALQVPGRAGHRPGRRAGTHPEVHGRRPGGVDRPAGQCRRGAAGTGEARRPRHRPTW